MCINEIATGRAILLPVVELLRSSTTLCLETPRGSHQLPPPPPCTGEGVETQVKGEGYSLQVEVWSIVFKGHLPSLIMWQYSVVVVVARSWHNLYNTFKVSFATMLSKSNANYLHKIAINLRYVGVFWVSHCVGPRRLHVVLETHPGMETFNPFWNLVTSILTWKWPLFFVELIEGAY